MNLESNTMTICFKHLTFVLMFLALVTPQLNETVAFLSNSNHELTKAEGEKGADEKEKQVNEEEKIELQIVASSPCLYCFDDRSALYGHLAALHDNLYSEINIPPPEFI